MPTSILAAGRVHTRMTTLLVAIAALATASTSVIAQETLVALTSTGNLIRFNSATPGTVAATTPITGLQAGETIVGIDFRPATAGLYGIGSTSRLYLIDPLTGVATVVGGVFSTLLSGTAFGVDFNPVVDRIRIVSNTGQNFRINPNNGTVAGVDTPLNPGSPSAVGAAYSNNNVGAVASTLFVIDSSTNHLARQGGAGGTPSANGGMLTDIGPLGVTLSSNNAGFDISASGMAYASLTVGGVSGLYMINLATGATTLVGAIGGGVTVTGLTVAPIPPLSVSDASVSEGNSGTVNLDFTISLSFAALDTVSVDIATSDGTATVGTDYTAVSQTLTFPAGQLSKTVSVPVLGDTTLEPDETLMLTLSNAIGATIADATGVGTILNDEIDTDGDGVSDAQDGCPNDPAKTSPGACGCGVVDTDSDGDGVADCIDGCPSDPAKSSPGYCGCGNPETDSDGDGIPDCKDNCPDTPNADQADADSNGTGDACEPAPARTGACGIGLCGAGLLDALPMIGLGWLGLRRRSPSRAHP